jgi:hypothetical protein
VRGALSLCATQTRLTAKFVSDTNRLERPAIVATVSNEITAPEMVESVRPPTDARSVIETETAPTRLFVVLSARRAAGSVTLIVWCP